MHTISSITVTPDNKIMWFKQVIVFLPGSVFPKNAAVLQGLQGSLR
jgi:hypothetical protein